MGKPLLYFYWICVADEPAKRRGFRLCNGAAPKSRPDPMRDMTGGLCSRVCSQAVTQEEDASPNSKATMGDHLHFGIIREEYS